MLRVGECSGRGCVQGTHGKGWGGVAFMPVVFPSTTFPFLQHSGLFDSSKGGKDRRTWKQQMLSHPPLPPPPGRDGYLCVLKSQKPVSRKLSCLESSEHLPKAHGWVVKQLPDTRTSLGFPGFGQCLQHGPSLFLRFRGLFHLKTDPFMFLQMIQ